MVEVIKFCFLQRELGCSDIGSSSEVELKNVQFAILLSKFKVSSTGKISPGTVTLVEFYLYRIKH